MSTRIASILVLVLAALGGLLAKDPAQPKIEWQRGPCLGGNRPALACKTCRDCTYCGTRGPRGMTPRPGNSATCVVCAEQREKR